MDPIRIEDPTDNHGRGWKRLRAADLAYDVWMVIRLMKKSVFRRIAVGSHDYELAEKILADAVCKRLDSYAIFGADRAAEAHSCGPGRSKPEPEHPAVVAMEAADLAAREADERAEQIRNAKRMTPDELMSLLLRMLTGVTTEPESYWRNVIGPIAVSAQALDVEAGNWAVHPTGSRADLAAVEKAVAMIRRQVPFATNASDKIHSSKQSNRSRTKLDSNSIKGFKIRDVKPGSR